MSLIKTVTNETANASYTDADIVEIITRLDMTMFASILGKAGQADIDFS